jgi:hypothetical protein
LNSELHACKAGTQSLETSDRVVSKWTPSPFCSGYFGDGIQQTICPGWLQTEILLISASQIVSITGVSRWPLAERDLLLIKSVYRSTDSLLPKAEAKGAF